MYWRNTRIAAAEVSGLRIDDRPRQDFRLLSLSKTSFIASHKGRLGGARDDCHLIRRELVMRPGAGCTDQCFGDASRQQEDEVA
jgi:hypothetical protein